MAARSANLDPLIPPDHLVRLVAEFIDAEDVERLGFATSGEAVRELAAAWLYGLLVGLRAPKALEVATHENVPLMWLLHGKHLNAGALARFYAMDRESLALLLKRFIHVAVELGLGDSLSQGLGGEKRERPGPGQATDAGAKDALLQRADEIVRELEWSFGAAGQEPASSIAAAARVPLAPVGPQERQEFVRHILRDLEPAPSKDSTLSANVAEQRGVVAETPADVQPVTCQPDAVTPRAAVMGAASRPATLPDRESAAPPPSRIIELAREYRKLGLPWLVTLATELVLRITGLLGVALQRFWHQVGLTILALLSVVLAVGLVTSAGFFSQAVDQALLNQQLTEFTRITGRPPFSVQVYYFPPATQPMSLEGAEDARGFVAQTLGRAVGLPIRLTGLIVHGGNLPLRPPEGALYDTSLKLQDVMLTHIADVEPHLEVVGNWDDAPAGAELPVWMHSTLAAEMGLQVGERLEIELGEHVEPLPIVVTGLWQARDPKDLFWLRDPNETMQRNLLVRRDDYIQRVEPRLSMGTRYVDWHVVLDEGAVVPDQVRQYLSGFEKGMREINRYLPDARIVDPGSPMQTFVRQQTTLTLRLLTFNMPAFGFLLYFLALTSVIIVRWQRRELAILISRGTGVTNILAITFLEEVIAFAVGTPLGVGLGMVLARMMGASTGAFSGSWVPSRASASLPVSLHGLNPALVGGALLVALAARLFPSLQAARQSVVQQEREYTRPITAPFWYRYFLDFLLVIPTGYAYRRIGAARALNVLLQESPQDIFRDPLLVLVPALFVLTAGLLAMRLFPLIMRLLDGLADRVPWVTPYLAARQVGRQSESYINPLLLIIVSLALGIYTYSMVGSLDRWLVDHQYYEAGADIAFTPLPQSGDYDPAGGAEWIPSPEVFETLPGVAEATRVGNYKSEVLLQGREWLASRFVGLDYYDFPTVAWFRDDLADQPLVGLMNRLAVQQNGVLVSEKLLASSGLSLGDQINVRIELAYTVSFESVFTIVGTYRYFPTIQDGTEAIVGNLEYVFNYLGVPFQHNIWLKLDQGASGRDVLASVKTLQIDTFRRQDTGALLAEEQSRLEQVGVLGALSIGLLAAAAMAILGLLIYGYASIRERSYRFGVLRALGLSKWQAIGQVAAEYVLLAVYGAGAGAAVGAGASKLFMPYFGTVARGPSPLPPLLPVLVGSEIAVIAGAFALLTILLQLAVVSISVRKRLFQLMRMGQ